MLPAKLARLLKRASEGGIRDRWQHTRDLCVLRLWCKWCTSSLETRGSLEKPGDALRRCKRRAGAERSSSRRARGSGLRALCRPAGLPAQPLVCCGIPSGVLPRVCGTLSGLVPSGACRERLPTGCGRSSACWGRTCVGGKCPGSDRSLSLAPHRRRSRALSSVPPTAGPQTSPELQVNWSTISRELPVWWNAPHEEYRQYSRQQQPGTSTGLGAEQSPVGPEVGLCRALTHTGEGAVLPGRVSSVGTDPVCTDGPTTRSLVAGSVSDLASSCWLRQARQ